MRKVRNERGGWGVVAVNEQLWSRIEERRITC
jgi:hypothetical protein